MVYRVILTIALTTRLVAAPSAQEMEEYQVKAAFLSNFAKFVEWPADFFKDPAESFSICVLGRDPFGAALDRVVGSDISGHPIAVRRIADVHQTAGCHILFISSSERKRMLPIFMAAKQAGVLIVGESGNAASDGVVINFTLDRGRVRFQIDMVAAEEQKLRVSSKLLNLAIAVKR